MEGSETSLIIFQANVNSARSRKDQLLLKINKIKQHGKVPIILLNDTRLHDKVEFDIDGFSTYRRDHSSNTHFAGGVAILVPDQLTVIEINTAKNLPIETLILDITVDNMKLRICTTYPHPGQLLSEDLFDLLDSMNSANVTVLMGDLNCHLGLLPNHIVNRSGHVLKNLIDTYGYKMMNDLELTYFCNSSSREELLDICLMKETQTNLSSGTPRRRLEVNTFQQYLR